MHRVLGKYKKEKKLKNIEKIVWIVKNMGKHEPVKWANNNQHKTKQNKTTEKDFPTKKQN